MSKVKSFLQMHWTWIFGLLGTIWTYASPSVASFLSHAVQNYPSLSVFIGGVIAWLAHVSPSPLGSSGSPKFGGMRGIGGAIALGLLFACLIMAPVTMLSGCNPATWLQEASNIVTLISPLGDGIAAIVEMSDPAIAPAVQAGSSIYDNGTSKLASLLHDWSVAAAAAQPGILDQIQTMLAVLKADASNLISLAQVKNAARQAAISKLGGSILAEIAALLTVIPQIQAAGGRTSSLAAISDKLTVKPDVEPSAARNQLVKSLRKKTGDSSLDSINSGLASRLASLKI